MQVRANGIAIEIERRGDTAGAPALMIMGLAMQLVAWPDSLVDGLVARGLGPVLFDNRDCGLSQDFESAGTPNMFVASMRHALHLPVEAPYSLDDMAADAIGVLDALQIPSAHIVGVSMGGMIAQEIALSYPARVRSLTLLMTTSGSRLLPGPTWRARSALLSRPRSASFEDLVEHTLAVRRAIGSPGYPSEDSEIRPRVERWVRRAWKPRGLVRQLAAVVAARDRTRQLAAVRQPTLVIHGREDPLVPAACGMDLARRIPGARLELVDGMGHDLPTPLMPWLATRIADHCAATG